MRTTRQDGNANAAVRPREVRVLHLSWVGVGWSVG